MIIVSQDKKTLVNFNNIAHLFIPEEGSFSNGKYKICYGNLAGSRSDLGEYKELGVIADIKDIEPKIEDEDYYQCDVPKGEISMEFELSKKDEKKLRNTLIPKTKKEKINIYNKNKNNFRNFIKRK